MFVMTMNILIKNNRTKNKFICMMNELLKDFYTFCNIKIKNIYFYTFVNKFA